MHIDRSNGTVALPNGVTISSSLTQDGFRRMPAFVDAKAQDFGTPPWIHYYINGGQIEGKELHVHLCFYDQMLVNVSLSVDHYAPGAWDWSRYSLDIEAETKHFHDQMLQQMFGPPSKGGSFFFRRLPDRKVTLERRLDWNFPWGVVSSGHDWKGGGTAIIVGYGNRRDQAYWAYRRRIQSHSP